MTLRYSGRRLMISISEISIIRKLRPHLRNLFIRWRLRSRTRKELLRRPWQQKERGLLSARTCPITCNLEMRSSSAAHQHLTQRAEQVVLDLFKVKKIGQSWIWGRKVLARNRLCLRKVQVIDKRGTQVSAMMVSKDITYNYIIQMKRSKQMVTHKSTIETSQALLIAPRILRRTRQLRILDSILSTRELGKNLSHLLIISQKYYQRQKKQLHTTMIIKLKNY